MCNRRSTIEDVPMTLFNGDGKGIIIFLLTMRLVYNSLYQKLY